MKRSSKISAFSIVVFLSSCFIFAGCNKVFEFSPYEAGVKEEYLNTTAQNLTDISAIPLQGDSFSIAVISDSHYFYDNLKMVLDDINKRDEVLFVICTGDIAHQGLLKEFELFYETMRELQKPYITVIGNHDYRSNGELIYKDIFGAFNYSFSFGGVKFVLFDDVVWESNKSPDFNWLSSQIIDGNDYNQTFVFSHIPPNSDQFDDHMEETYRALMDENDIDLSVHGHSHKYLFDDMYNSGMDYLWIPDLKEPKYCIVDVWNTSFNVELIEL